MMTSNVSAVRIALEEYPELLSMFQEFTNPENENLTKLKGVVLTRSADNKCEVTAFGETLHLCFSMDFRDAATPLGRIEVKRIVKDELDRPKSISISTKWYDRLGNILVDPGSSHASESLEIGNGTYLAPYLVNILTLLIDGMATPAKNN